MEERIIDIVDEKLYYKKLDNGLEVYMVPNTNVKNTYATFTTKYGSMHDEFVPIGESKMISVPKGIAHFLEHKMFEMEDGIDPFTFYSKSGTDANAHTTLQNTTYEFAGPNNFLDNICYLLDYVQTLYLTDENVEKEKGIIEQELRMYMDDPIWVMYDGVRNNAFNKHPIKYPIGGTIKSVYQITKKDLKKCYNTFYHPSNMFLVITGNFDPEITINVIEKNQNSKKFKEVPQIKIKDYKESDKVAKTYEEIEKNVETNKFAYGIKINLGKIINMSEKKRNYYLSIIFESLFGMTSEFYEKMIEKNYILSPIEIDKVYTNTHLFVTLLSETLFPKELFAEIDNLLKNIDISLDDLEMHKKVLISSEIKLYDNIIALNDSIVNNVIKYGRYDANTINLVRTMNLDEARRIIKRLDLSNRTLFVVKPLTNQ